MDVQKVLQEQTYYGNASSINNNEGMGSFYIFRVEIPDNELLQDADELEMNYKMHNPRLSAIDSLKMCGCVSVNHDIDREKYKIEYAEISFFTPNNELRRLLKNLVGEYRWPDKAVPTEIIMQFDTFVEWKTL